MWMEKVSRKGLACCLDVYSVHIQRDRGILGGLAVFHLAHSPFVMAVLHEQIHR